MTPANYQRKINEYAKTLHAYLYDENPLLIFQKDFIYNRATLAGNTYFENITAGYDVISANELASEVLMNGLIRNEFGLIIRILDEILDKSEEHTARDWACYAANNNDIKNYLAQYPEFFEDNYIEDSQYDAFIEELTKKLIAYTNDYEF